jgi:hypothetical protein
MGEGVEATVHSSNISKNKERYFFTEDMLRKAVIFEVGKDPDRDSEILESRIETVETVRASLRQVSLLAGLLEKRSFHQHLLVFFQGC